METIRIHRNNSGVAKITLKSKSDGTAWNIPIGNELQFTVKKSVTDSDEEIIFFKTATGDGGNEYDFFLTGFDTDIMPGNYKWDIKDKTANDTLCLVGDLKILETVYRGEAVTGAENEDIEIECFVEMSGFQYVSDYNLLYNKPQINSVEMSGNKTGSDLGLADLTVTDAIDNRLTETEEDINVLDIGVDDLYSTKADKSELPEKLSDLTNDEGFVSEATIDSKDTATLNTAKAYTDAEIAELDIPTKTSDLTNDSGFITSAYHDSTKLDKQTTTTGNYAYTYNAAGSSSTQIVNGNTTAGTIAQRAADGSVYAETPATGNNKQLANRGYVDTADAAKLDKVTASHAYSRVYAVNPSGEQTLINAVAKSTNAGTVPLTTTGGRIKTPEPINSDELTTKNYVDTHLSAKLDKPTTPTEKSVVTVDTDGTVGTGKILPAFTEEDEGKVLGIANGALAWTYFADLDNIDYPQENE